MYTKGGLIVTKQEMMKIWIDGAFVPVTLVKLLPQEIVRYKTMEKDGYCSAVVGVQKKDKVTGKNESAYKSLVEFLVDASFAESHQVDTPLGAEFLEGVKTFSVVGVSKGKGYQGLIKRWNMKGGSATHGHKFTRTGASKGSKKPRRTQKGHHQAGHMGLEKITLKGIKLLETMEREGETLLVLKGSLPGHKNGILKLIVE